MLQYLFHPKVSFSDLLVFLLFFFYWFLFLLPTSFIHSHSFSLHRHQITTRFILCSTIYYHFLFHLDGQFYPKKGHSVSTSTIPVGAKIVMELDLSNTTPSKRTLCYSVNGTTLSPYFTDIPEKVYFAVWFFHLLSKSMLTIDDLLTLCIFWILSCIDWHVL